MTLNICIIGSALDGNKGAAAMLEAAVEGLTERIPDAQFFLLSMYPEDDRRLNPYPNLTIVDARPVRLGVLINLLALLWRIMPPLRSVIVRGSTAIRALVSSNVLIDQGGITFADGREKFLLYNVASILPALLVGTPIVKCAQAVGPFEGALNRAVSKFFLPKLDLIVTRGAITHALAADLGLLNLQSGADLAFTLPTVSTVQSSARSSNAVGRVAVSPSVVIRAKIDQAGGDYVRRQVEFIEFLANRKYEIVLFPHSFKNNPKAVHNNDLSLCQEIYDAINDETKLRVENVFSEKSSRQLRELIASCEVLVTSRFHAMVSALATGTPVLVIGWSHKYREVLDMFGVQEWSFPHSELTDGKLLRMFEDLWSRRRCVAESMQQNLGRVRKIADQQLNTIAEISARRSRRRSSD